MVARPISTSQSDGTDKFFIIDTGGSTVKAGYSTDGQCSVMLNAIVKSKNEKTRIFVADEIEACRDLSALYFLLPIQRGYVVNTDQQHLIWSRVLSAHSVTQPDLSTVIVTEPVFNFGQTQDSCDAIMFRQFQFGRMLRLPSADLVAYQHKVDNPKSQCCVVVDCGFSYTHVIPYVRGRRVQSRIVRIDVGGKLLTNHLKDVISYRQLHVMDETHVLNDCKEDSCYVSLDLATDLRTVEEHRPGTRCGQVPCTCIVRRYLLPDFTTRRRGSLLDCCTDIRTADDEQSLVMGSERMAVPEIIFHPSDVGINQMGLAEAIVHAIASPPGLVVCKKSESTSTSAVARTKLTDFEQSQLFANIVLVGGSSKFANFSARLGADVRKLASDKFQVAIHQPTEPTTYAWSGGQSLARAMAANPTLLAKLTVSRSDYLKRGPVECAKKFAF